MDEGTTGANPIDAGSVDATVLGWEKHSRQRLDPPEGFGISRVAIEHRGAFELMGPFGYLTASLEPGLRRKARSPEDFPAVGDWVVHELAPSHDRRVVLTELLERHSVLMRRAAGHKPTPQIVAANVDVMGVVTTTELLTTGADNEDGYRLERYLVAAAQGGVQAVLVVNKADLAEPDLAAIKRRFAAAADPVKVLATSAITGAGISELAELAANGSTLALAGASGVGKSSLVNCLLGREAVEVGSVGASGSGRHTTIRRELFVVAGTAAASGSAAGATLGTVIDTPGLADLVPWTSGSRIGLDQVFADVAQLAQQCHFSDCSHRSEPNCAVREAVEQGRLAPRRLDIYLTLAQDQD